MDGGTLTIDDSDGGELNIVTGYIGVWALNEGTATVTSISDPTPSNSLNGYGIIAESGSSVTVTGDIKVTSYIGEGFRVYSGAFVHVMGNINSLNGVYAGGSGAEAVVDGNISASSGSGVEASSGGTITVKGNVTAAYRGVSAYGWTDGGGNVHVLGNVTGNNYYGVEASAGSEVMIDGDVQSLKGLYAIQEGTSISVGGNTTSTGADEHGASAAQGGLVTIGGTITASNYIKVGDIGLAAEEGVNQGRYIVYTDGESTVRTMGIEFFKEDFESGMDGWDQSGTGWSVTSTLSNPTASTHSGNQVAMFNSYDMPYASQSRLYQTESLNLFNGSDYWLEFWMYHDASAEDSIDSVFVQISTDQGIHWNDLGRYYRYSGTEGWTKESISLATYAGQSDVRIAFLGMSGGDNNIFIDDVSISHECIIDGCEVTEAYGGYIASSEIGGETYYHVSTPEQLAHINDHLSLNFIQTADIDLSGVSWTPIGWVSNYYDQNLPFNGHYDGQGYSISNLKISSSISWAGLFAVAGSTAVLEDVILENVDIIAGYHSGALVGENRGRISGCTVTGTINGAGQFGGLVGMSHNGLIEDCHSSATVTGTGEAVGGLVGYSTNNSGSASDSIVRCSFTGNVSGNQRTGGLVGTLQGGLLSESFAAGNVSGSNTYTGGLVGVIESANGFIAAVRNCYSRSSVMASGSQYVGGLAGANWWGTIQNSYSAGTMNLDGATDSGGLTGMIYTGAVAVDSYYDSDLCGLSDTGKGIPKTTEEMKDLATYSTWSFPNVWTLSSDNNGYPALAWQGFTHGTISNDADLSSLSATNVTLSPDFQSTVTSYTASVANNVDSTTVAATANDSGAIVEINGTVATSQLVVLNVGSNIINVEVTAEDGVTTNAYTITINRAAASGSSGGGGGTISPVIIVTTETNNERTSNSITVDPNVSSDIANVSITKAMVNALLDKAEETGGTTKGDLIEVIVSTSADTEKLAFNIPQSELEKIAGGTSADFGISSPFVSIVFDGKAMDTISGAESGGTVSITVARMADLNGRPVYDLTVMNGNTLVSDFKGGHATVTIPYELKPGETPNAVVIYYLADDGTLKAVRGHYDESLKAVVFKTTHFSNFVIGYNPVSFNDVAAGAWYKDAIDFIAAREITSGTSVGKFSPEATLTRGQFIVLLMNAYGISPDAAEEGTTNFVDAGNTYYTNYLLAGKSLGIVNGIGNNMFAPEQAVTRQEMFVMLYNALEVIGELPQAYGDKQLSDFGDANQVASWAQEAMSALVEGGVISGSNGMLNPTVSTTRAQMAQMLYNLLSK
ncbi:S-layer homology domain-containing protein [Gudongella oleilytica]|uniref:S-layer homology domain-containing protein n=1 Tax=Gudongella oleilytica TaxID=1582259 RepID=UPI0013E8C5B4|nr:S-layer homology domain-containing protein [Gudongella oleilytica]